MDMSMPQVLEKISDLKDHMDKRFDEHDKRFKSIDKRFDEHDKRFKSIDKRFDEHDKRFDVLSKQIFDIMVRFDRLDDSVTLMRGENLEYKDTVMKLLIRHDQEIISINSRLKRIESRGN